MMMANYVTTLRWGHFHNKGLKIKQQGPTLYFGNVSPHGLYNPIISHKANAMMNLNIHTNLKA
jgi:hypothetical protein